jgi:hypothetical protein
MAGEKGRQHVFECVCGNRILFELDAASADEGAGEVRRTRAIYTETGARLIRCPRCGTEVTGTENGPDRES